MPHLILEYSQNVGQTDDLDPLFLSLQETLAELGDIDIGNCKVRARPADVYRVAHGGKNGAFVHLDVRFLSGRTSEMKRTLGLVFLDILKDWFADSSTTLDLQITVEIHDIDRETYFKYPSGTLSPG